MATYGEEELVANAHLLLIVVVRRKVGDLIREYVRSHPNSMALLSFGGTVLGVRLHAFSSRALGL
jgi:hypothetical protein